MKTSFSAQHIAHQIEALKTQFSRNNDLTDEQLVESYLDDVFNFWHTENEKFLHYSITVPYWGFTSGQLLILRKILKDANIGMAIDSMDGKSNFAIFNYLA